jgi:hypothetical protein
MNKRRGERENGRVGEFKVNVKVKVKVKVKV